MSWSIRVKSQVTIEKNISNEFADRRKIHAPRTKRGSQSVRGTGGADRCRRRGRRRGGGRGHNLVETLADPTAHAEMQALTAAAATLGGKYLQNCTLYVTVEPCIMCAGAIGWAQIGRVVWGADDPKKGYRRYSECVFHPRTTATGGVLAGECEALMTSFFAGLRS